MATKSTRRSLSKAVPKTKPKVAASQGGPARSLSGPQRNFLISASNGLFLKSGSTGQVRKLTDDEAAAISELLEKRQELGLKLSELLEKEDFVLSASGIWDGPT